MTIYDIIVTDNENKDIELSEYKGKVLLVVNTATGCGFTPQYKELQTLYDNYKDKGFEILDFPCNQFGHQAKGSDTEINNFCSLNYNTTFKRFKKIEVNGVNENRLYTYLKQQQCGILGKKIKWNFTKFLVDKEGNVIKRYSPTTNPLKIEEDINNALKKA